MDSIQTIQGDTWDTIAHRVYGDVLRTQDLMQARENVRLIDIEVFPGGVTVYTPEVETGIQETDLPDWRK